MSYRVLGIARNDEDIAEVEARQADAKLIGGLSCGRSMSPCVVGEGFWIRSPDEGAARPN
jgi:hypothetical protein